MAALRRGLIVLAVTSVLAVGLWVAAQVLGSPTPVPMEPGLDQPGMVGAVRTVRGLAMGTVVYVAVAAVVVLLTRVGILGRRRRSR